MLNQVSTLEKALFGLDPLAVGAIIVGSIVVALVSIIAAIINGAGAKKARSEKDEAQEREIQAKEYYEDIKRNLSEKNDSLENELRILSEANDEIKVLYNEAEDNKRMLRKNLDAAEQEICEHSSLIASYMRTLDDNKEMMYNKDLEIHKKDEEIEKYSDQIGVITEFIKQIDTRLNKVKEIFGIEPQVSIQEAETAIPDAFSDPEATDIAYPIPFEQ